MKKAVVERAKMYAARALLGRDRTERDPPPGLVSERERESEGESVVVGGSERERE